MYIYSGKCRMGKCGVKTCFKDSKDTDLFVGDIVVITDGDGYIVTLTAVVSNAYRSFSDGTIQKTPNNEIENYVMGIKGRENSPNWKIIRVKSYKNVVDGEKWEEFGFNYNAN